jgi:hypothetical protein
MCPHFKKFINYNYEIKFIEKNLKDYILVIKKIFLFLMEEFSIIGIILDDLQWF